jgi:AcrR family transcriptional regulator
LSRDEILDAAEALMARQGYDGASISAICSECGLPASSIYWHFGSKEGVLAAVMERGATRYFATIDAAGILLALQGREALRAGLLAASRAIAKHPEFLRLLVLLLLSGRAEDTVARVRAGGRERMHRLIALAYPVRGDAPNLPLADALADVALAMFDGAFLAVQNDPRIRYETLMTRMADALASLAEAAIAADGADATRVPVPTNRVHRSKRLLRK